LPAPSSRFTAGRALPCPLRTRRPKMDGAIIHGEACRIGFGVGNADPPCRLLRCATVHIEPLRLLRTPILLIRYVLQVPIPSPSSWLQLGFTRWFHASLFFCSIHRLPRTRQVPSSFPWFVRLLTIWNLPTPPSKPPETVTFPSIRTAPDPVRIWVRHPLFSCIRVLH
jgi:hypothetical protein